ncbi:MULTISPECIES: hypothetical protein [unclassified Halomonas]|uniref:hypothetical protein n=1 Tax=unclassified Halomonas TaxID=2609666 RepID=UPI0021E4BB65|nr:MULTISPECIES: hypothetical protein [unclassified Halomonas]UYG00431.1 hypothetical protein OCT39_02420 [Halomonas sp. GD1P12]WNL38494.1 hypothetical protein RN346_14515 [Halomonas sp. PAMB 3232]WNL41794.1 hypothetical protein RN347_14365 [Halomonas sp. PAMB 3264]
MLPKLIEFVRGYYRTEAFNPLPELVSQGGRKTYVAETIGSTFVSSVRNYVDKLEHSIAVYRGIPNSIATNKAPYPYEYTNDELGYNYVMLTPNSACVNGQIKQIETFAGEKWRLAAGFADHFEAGDPLVITEQDGWRSNYWLNAVIRGEVAQRAEWLKLIKHKIMVTLLIGKLRSWLPMYAHSPVGDISHLECLEKRVVNLASSLILLGRRSDA